MTVIRGAGRQEVFEDISAYLEYISNNLFWWQEFLVFFTKIEKVEVSRNVLVVLGARLKVIEELSEVHQI